jgi:hypothetical protein
MSANGLTGAGKVVKRDKQIEENEKGQKEILSTPFAKQIGKLWSVRRLV